MASEGDQVGRQVGRTLANGVLLLGSLAVLGVWASFGVYTVEPGENAIIFQLGRYDRTVTDPGLRFHLPPPIESHEKVGVATIEQEEFGGGADGDDGANAVVQTSDNNIVHLSFVVQYKVGDAFKARYRIAQPIETLRDAAQAAVREVVGRTNIDGVLSEKRGAVQAEARDLLQGILDRYDAGLDIIALELQEVQPPGEVRDAFDDVIGAAQDRSRVVNEAEGYANEVVPKARGEASELKEQAQGYRDAKIAEADGEASRFSALVFEYKKAPEVTKRRLYLETMEEILPTVDKVIIESGTQGILPYLPLRSESGGAR